MEAAGELDCIAMSEMNTRHIVIAASERKAGKTLLAQSLLRVAVDAGLDCAFVKLRRRHGVSLTLIPGEGQEGTDTFRCAASGASSVTLVEYAEPEQLSGYEPHAPSGHDLVLWETNSAMEFVRPHTMVYLEVEHGEGKTPELSSKANVVVPAPLSAPPSRELCDLILDSAGVRGFRAFIPRGKCWLETPRGTVVGSGIASLLRYIGQTGSISAGSKLAGISYRRAWTLLSRSEDNLGAKLIERSRGGRLKGGSGLTRLADRLLEEFENLEQSLEHVLKGGDEK